MNRISHYIDHRPIKARQHAALVLASNAVLRKLGMPMTPGMMDQDFDARQVLMGKTTDKGPELKP